MFKPIPEIMIDSAKIMLNAHEIDAGMNVKPGDSNFVTKYDVAVQKHLTEKFQEILPHAVIIGEESETNRSEKFKNSLSIIIDPIDGTTNFIHNYRHSTISVGIADRGELVYGAVYDPYQDSLYYAEKGKGAYLKQGNNTTRINVTTNNLSESLVCFGTSPYYRKELGDKTFTTAKWLFLHSQDLRRSGSAALDLCCLASGTIDVFFEYRLSPWDYAGAAVIIEESGGIITQFDGSPITLDQPCSILAATKPAYSEITEANIF